MCRFPGYQTVHLCTVVALSLSRDVFQTPRTGEWHGGIPCASSTTIIYSRCWVFRRMRLCKMVLRSVDVGIFLQDAQPDSRPRWRHRSWWRRPRWDLPAAEMQLGTDVGPLSVDSVDHLTQTLGQIKMANWIPTQTRISPEANICYSCWCVQPIPTMVNSCLRNGEKKGSSRK